MNFISRSFPSFKVCLLISGLLVATAVVSSAKADDTQKFRAAFYKGVKCFKEEDYRCALEAFQNAYDLKPHFKVLFNIGQSQDALGRYEEALATFKRYLTEGGGGIDSDIRETVERAIESIESKLGKLIVEVEPGGAAVLINDISAGETPFVEPIFLYPGQYRVRITKDGFIPFEKTVTIEQNREVVMQTKLPPKPALGKLRIEGAPDRAAVKVDGEIRGETPLPEPIALSPGRHNVQIGKDGYMPFERNVTIEKDKENILQAKLNPVPSPLGKLRIEGPPDGSAVQVNGEPKGKTPLSEPILMNPGRHRVRIAKEGYEPFEQDVTIKKGEENTLQAKLNPLAPRRLSGLLWTGIVTGALGLGGVGIGTYYSVQYNKHYDNVEKAAGEAGEAVDAAYQAINAGLPISADTREKHASAVNDYNTNKDKLPDDTKGIVAGFVSGGALVVTGIVLLAIDASRRAESERKSSQETPAVSVSPTPGGLMVTF